MLKGVAKRVVVIRSPDPKVFEQAFFIVREDVKHPDGVSGEEIVRQAQRIADRYVKSHRLRRLRHVRLAAILALAAAAAVLGGLIFFGVI